jgi:hypothetical protein
VIVQTSQKKNVIDQAVHHKYSIYESYKKNGNVTFVIMMMLLMMMMIFDSLKNAMPCENMYVYIYELDIMMCASFSFLSFWLTLVNVSACLFNRCY